MACLNSAMILSEMRNTIKCLALGLALTASIPTFGQYEGMRHKRSDGYVWPTDSLVLKKLDQWKDLKYGVIFHWGLYSVPGIMESWVLCGEDLDWIENARRKDLNYEDYKRWYWSHKDSINPVKFDPDKWADLMAKGGMKYMVFTTKHHEGFCMFDTKQTDFSIMNSPFGKDPRANVTKHVFDAFRKKGFMIGAYFSKPDWHSEYYWWPFYPTKVRNVNYNIARHPDRWEKFCQFTYNQINELTNGDYGNVDILWLDGGQVAPGNNQDIHMDKIAAMARKNQPGLIVVDRTVKGEFENYQTPEGEVPATQLDIPWETCYSLYGWGWRKGATLKSSKKVLAVLIEVVAKGGNFLLGVGPKPDGTIEEQAVDRVTTIGKWLDKNGEAIYATVNARKYNDGNVWFTQSKDGKKMYAMYALKEDDPEVPAVIEWTGNIPAGKKVTLLSTGKRVKCEMDGDRVKVYLPKHVDRTESLAFSFGIK